MFRHRAWALTRQVTLALAGLSFLLCMPALLLAAQLVGDTTPKLEGPELIKELKHGGYVIYFRHGTTSKVGEKTVTPDKLDNCKIQRNLSPEGVVQTKNIGTAFKRYRIPVGDVLSSPYCRCVDTAMNIFGKVEKTDFLHFTIHSTETNRQLNTQKLLDSLAKPPRAGQNTGLVAHTTNLLGAVKIFPQPEGVAHVFKPEGGGNFSYVGMILPETWLDVQALMAENEENKRGWFNSVGRWFRDIF